jgi:VCBS repeat-containing protein
VAQPCTIILANGSGSCSITFTAAGNKEVTATYAGDSRFGGSSDNDTHRVRQNSAPTAAFSSDGCNGLTCEFTDRSRDTDGTITKWEWTFGDGGTSGEQNPSHTYGTSGTYNVTLKVTDNDGATSQASSPVVVNRPPTAGNDPDGGGAYQAVMNVPLNVPAPALFANDSDPEGETLTAELGAQAAHGTASVDPAGGFTYTPDPGYTGADQFTYHVTDQHNQVSNEATVSIFVNP